MKMTINEVVAFYVLGPGIKLRKLVWKHWEIRHMCHNYRNLSCHLTFCQNRLLENQPKKYAPRSFGDHVATSHCTLHYTSEKL